MTTGIRRRMCLFAACAVLSTSAIALADGAPTGGGQDPPTPPPPPGHDALFVPQVSIVDALVQAIPALIQTLVL